MKLATIASLAGIGLMMAAGAAQAQYSPTLGRITRGPAASIPKAMTQAQARRACQMQMRGARESRSSIRQKMQICMRQKMEGA